MLRWLRLRARSRRVLRHLWTIDEDMGKLARANRERTIQNLLAIFRGRGVSGDTTAWGKRSLFFARACGVSAPGCRRRLRAPGPR